MPETLATDPQAIAVAIVTAVCSAFIVRVLRNRGKSPSTVRTGILGAAMCLIGTVLTSRGMVPVALIGGGVSLMGSSILVDLRGWARFNMDVFGSIIRMYSDFQTSRAIMALMGVVPAAGGAIAIGYVFFPWGKP